LLGDSDGQHCESNQEYAGKLANTRSILQNLRKAWEKKVQVNWREFIAALTATSLSGELPAINAGDVRTFADINVAN
jgi:hypothetical protein